MATHFRFHDKSPAVAPWNARYPFPTSSMQAVKTTPRIVPKNGLDFNPGNVIRIELPAQGYIDFSKSYLTFDVELSGFSTLASDAVSPAGMHFNNNIQSTIERLRILYGSTTLEDIPKYNMIVRSLTEWTSSSQMDNNQTSVNEGIGGKTVVSTGAQPVTVNQKQSFIQGQCYSEDFGTAENSRIVPNGDAASAPAVSATAYKDQKCIRRYCVQLAAGLMNQSKLMLTKFMAAQFVIEITLAQPAYCMQWFYSATHTGAPSYKWKNVQFIPEMLEFTPSYDATIMEGLASGGVPIKYASWHHYIFPCTGSVHNLLIQERSKSIKSIFCCLRRSNPLNHTDAGASLYGLPGVSLVQFQFRIGGRYFPAAPVQCSTTLADGTIVPSAGEAYMELAKALNIQGDYRLSTFVNPLSFGVVDEVAKVVAENPGNIYPTECDHKFDFQKHNRDGSLKSSTSTFFGVTKCGEIPPSNFAMATSLETSNGFEISGLNGTEQSDISLITQYTGALDAANFQFEVYVHYDSMIVLGENNTLQLIN